jgi:hypothetical protein
MALPHPVPGLVIRYSYLWRNEALKGQEEGNKDRPCAIILATMDKGGRQYVAVLPITHSAPMDRDTGLELPRDVKTRLGLDHLPSWIILSEYNFFEWPGYDLRTIENTGGTSYSYGHLPASLTRKMIEMVFKKARLHQLKRVDRD